MKKRMQRLCIYPKDVQRITGRSERYSRNLIRRIMQELNKKEHQFLTVSEFCIYTGIDEEKVKRVKTGLETVDVTTISQMFKILSDETRVKIVYALLTENELCVCDLANIVEATVATTSHHLRFLKKQGSVANFKKNSKYAMYELIGSELAFDSDGSVFSFV